MLLMAYLLQRQLDINCSNYAKMKVNFLKKSLTEKSIDNILYKDICRMMRIKGQA